MAWQGIEGHDAIVERFRRSLASERLASTFLFVGPEGIGKRMLALKLAQALLCDSREEQALEPCGKCGACQQVVAQSHPDLIVMGKPPDKSFIPVEAFIGDREHRMQTGLCHEISLKPFRGGRKIAIIEDADYLNQEGANCLLKTLEEPPPKSVLILIGTSEQRQLPTIRSRCQIVRFEPLSDETLAGILLEARIADSPQHARELAELGNGSLTTARRCADPDLLQFREDFVGRLTRLHRNSTGLAGEVAAFVDAAGKEAAPRRERLRIVIEFALAYYRELLRSSGGVKGVEAIANSIERCLDAQAQVDANANQATLIECWIDDLAECTQRVAT